MGPMGAGMGQPMPPMAPPMGAPMGAPMGQPMGQPMGHPMAPPMAPMPTSPMSMPAPIPQYQMPAQSMSMPTQSYAPPIQYAGSYVGPAQSYAAQSYGAQSYGAQSYGAQSYAPPIQSAQSYIPGQPAYGQPRVIQQKAPVVQQQPAAQAEEKITVSITGREGVNDVINGTFQSCGDHGGRYCFYAPTNEGPIYLYYDQAADNWCIGDQIGSQSYYAVCGPSNGEDMAQEWRIWTGEAWENDARIVATIK